MKAAREKCRWGLVLALTLLLSGCGGPPQPTRELSWPAPPQEPRVVYVKSLYGGQNLKRSFFGKIKDFLFGKEPRFVIGKPYGVAFDGANRILIADTAKKGILVLDLGAGSTELYTSLGAEGRLIEPVYVAIGPDGMIYVSDTALRRVMVFDASLRFSHFIGAEDEFEGPVGLSWSPDGQRLYVVDTQSHQVKVFDSGGEFLFSIGERGDGPGQFYFPTTVAVADDGTIYVVDSFHFAVQAFDSTGTYLNSFGSTAATLGSLARPRDIATDSDGHLYVTDAVRNNVQVFDGEGNLLMFFGTAGREAGEFQLPAGIFIDNDDNIYVSDSINRRIQIFRYLADR